MPQEMGRVPEQPQAEEAEQVLKNGLSPGVRGSPGSSRTWSNAEINK